MIEQVRNSYVPTEVSPPGETLRELLEEREISQADLAARMGRPKKTISEIVNGKAAITPDTALELELVLGVPAEFWNNRERSYRSSLARREQEGRLEEDYGWCRRFPLRQMQRLRWVPECRERSHCVRTVLEFFGVASRAQWRELYSTCEVAYRKSAAFEVDEFALTAWLRRGEVQAEDVDTEPYDRARFLEALSEVRPLTRQPPEVFQPTVQALCAAAGVVVLFVPELPRSRVCGATRWLSPARALIQLSLRYKTDDHLWFTFFHEAAHLLLHGKRLIFLDVTHREGKEEQEANAWAANFLIPPDHYAELVERELSVTAIKLFADRIGIAPGIVVGRLQHDSMLPHTQGNALKRRFRWVAPADAEEPA